MAGWTAGHAVAVDQAGVALRVERSSSAYRLDAITAEELTEQFTTQRPRLLQKNHWHALTELDLRLEYRLDAREDTCRMVEPLLVLHIHQHMPEWHPRSEAAVELHDQWSSVQQALHAHEQGHQQLAIKSAQRMAKVLGELQPSADCRGLVKRVESVWLREWTRMEVRQANYDQRTENGIRQGAVLTLQQQPQRPILYAREAIMLRLDQ
nr:DUF922 domain-containing protein [Pseudomarimonas arenosa]